MDIERERGITIKAQTAALRYKAKDGQIYHLNLIDTPGHVDFSYEVSRSLAACEGALLVVDASQGVEAQTVANCYTAIEQGVEVVPVLNKIDLPSANPDNARQEIEDVIGLDASEAVLASAKTGLGVEDILEAVVARIPAPQGDPEAPLKALIIDSWFDNYVGVVMLVRVVDGVLRPKDRIRLMSTGTVHLCEQVGVFTPKSQSLPELAAGGVGFIISGIKELTAAKVGDTVTLADRPAAAPLPGFKEIKSQVFAGLYPVEANQYDSLRESLEKLKLNDAALQFEPEVSQALGFGFRCGFLGLLHMNRGVTQALADVDVVLFVIEAGRFDAKDQKVLDLLPKDRPVILVVNKVDKLEDKGRLLPFLAQIAKKRDFAALLPVSAAKGRQLDELLTETRKHLPNPGLMFSEDEITDRSERFLAAEYIREKLFRLLGDELPYAATVEIEKFEVEGRLRRIYAAIVVDRPGHKAIVIGKGGATLKRISTEARQDMERLFDGKVYLEVWVKVKSGWADDDRLLRSLGYE